MYTDIKTAFGLAARDLWAEKIMTLCLVLAIAAVVTPLLVLGSLKVGFVDRLTNELIKDPTYRELTPGDANIKTEAFLDILRNSEHIEFSVPTVMMVPREIVFRKSDAPDRFEGRLVPTGEGDPLLKKAGVKNLKETEILLSQDLAEQAGLTVDDELQILVFRTLRNKRERASTTLKVVGIFPAEFSKTPTIIAHPILDTEIEGWRAGLPVVRLNWQGTETAMRQSYTQLHLATDHKLTQFALDALETRLGASLIEIIKWSNFVKEMALEPRSDVDALTGKNAFHYRVTRSNGKFVTSDIEAVPSIIDETNVLVSGISPTSQNANGSSIHYVDFRLLGNACRPYCTASRDTYRNLNDFSLYGEKARDGITISVDFSDELTFSVNPLAGLSLSKNTYLADWRLGGFLGRSEDTEIAYDATANRFFEKTTGFRGFRAIAKDLYSVVEATDLIRESGFSVRSSDNAIRRLQKLDQGLNILVAVVAGVALFGGFFVLGINFFANVQRKKLSFATLRLLGMRKTSIFLHPFFQSLAIVLLGYFFSLLCYYLVQNYINSAIAHSLGFGGNLSALWPIHLILAFFIVLGGSVLSCLVSAFYIMRVDPSIALKEGSQ